jgi:oligopeptide transport system substrate-binding protein
LTLRPPFTSLAALAALLLASVPSFAADVLHRPSESEPGTLDPQKMTAGNAIAIDRDLFMGLITLDPDGKPVPGAATSWDIAPDGKSWIFHLRHDGRWSNGDPVTAEDFVYSFRRLVDPQTAADDPSDLKQVVNYEAIVSGKEKDLTKLGVSAPDPYTLKLTLTEPRLALKFLLTDPQVFPLHKATLEKWGRDWTQPGHMVSNGAYVLTSWTPQAEIVMAKNPNFYDAAAVKIDEVHWTDVEDINAALRRYRAGELDWVPLTRDTIDFAEKNLADQLVRAPINSYGFVFFNMTKGPLSQDVRLRKALNLATDRETLVRIDKLHSLPAYNLTPPVISDYTAPTMPFKDEPMPQRIEEAKKLMEDAGYGLDNHLKFTITYPTRESTRQELLAITQMWKAIYVDLSIENSEWQVYENTVNNHNFEAGVMSGLGSYDDYENGLDNYRSDAGFFNWCGYSNPKFDDLFHRGGTSLDVKERRDLMQQAEAVVLNDYPVIPLAFTTRNVVVSPKLVGYNPSVVYPQSRHLSFKE